MKRRDFIKSAGAGGAVAAATLAAPAIAKERIEMVMVKRGHAIFRDLARVRSASLETWT